MLVLVSMVCACSPRVLYPKLDWIIPWYIDDYVSLDRSQKSQVSSRLARQLDWHCRTQLPQYAEFLRNIRRDVDSSDQTLTVERLEVYNDQLSRHWNELIKQLGPDIIDILVSASDEQIAELFENLERNNREKEIEYVEQSPEQIARNRQSRMQKRLRYWFSYMTESQKQAVGEWSHQLEPIAADWIGHRRIVQDRARRLLEHRNTSAEFESEFIAMLTTYQKLRSQTFQRKIDINTKRTLALLVNLSKTLTKSQGTHFSNRIRSLVADLDQLSCDPALKANRARMKRDS